MANKINATSMIASAAAHGEVLTDLLFVDPGQRSFASSLLKGAS
jgi:hypothetical protein